MAQPNVQTTQNDQSTLINPLDAIRNQTKLDATQIREVERISRISPYLALPRDANLFNCLNKWRDSRICGRVITLDALGIVKALDVYLDANTRQRGGLIQVPATTVSITMEKNYREKDILLAILEFLSNPIICGSLRDLRKRAVATIKSYKVRNIIVVDSHYLSYGGFNELMSIARKLDISVVLVGMPYMDQLLLSDKPHFVNIKDTFENEFVYQTLSLQETGEVVKTWESQALGLIKPLNLFKNNEVIKELHNASGGKLSLLYISLRKVIAWHLEHPKAQLNHINIAQAVSITYK